MTGYTLLRQIKLGPLHRPTRKTRHYQGGKELSDPTELRIIKYLDAPGYYLLYLDSQGVELTDTYHETLESALAQAEWEFQVTPKEWEILEAP